MRARDLFATRATELNLVADRFEALRNDNAMRICRWKAEVYTALAGRCDGIGISDEILAAVDTLFGDVYNFTSIGQRSKTEQTVAQLLVGQCISERPIEDV